VRWRVNETAALRNPKNTCPAMVIHTGGNKRKGTRADLATGDRGNGSTQFNSKDVPQFAQNFSVYVLPPDVVCLYPRTGSSFFTANSIARSRRQSGRKERRGDHSQLGEKISVRQDQ